MRRNFSSAQCVDSDPQFPPKSSQYSDRALMPDLSLGPGSYSTMSSSSPSPIIRSAGGRRPTRERIISRNMNGTSKYFVFYQLNRRFVWKTFIISIM